MRDSIFWDYLIWFVYSRVILKRYLRWCFIIFSFLCFIRLWFILIQWVLLFNLLSFLNSLFVSFFLFNRFFTIFLLNSFRLWHEIIAPINILWSEVMLSLLLNIISFIIFLISVKINLHKVNPSTSCFFTKLFVFSISLNTKHSINNNIGSLDLLYVILFNVWMYWKCQIYYDNR